VPLTFINPASSVVLGYDLDLGSRPDVISHMLPFGTAVAAIQLPFAGLDSIQTDLGSV
jgi:hypothetical protein